MKILSKSKRGSRCTVDYQDLEVALYALQELVEHQATPDDHRREYKAALKQLKTARPTLFLGAVE